MEPTSPSVYSTFGFRRSALQSRVSVLLNIPSSATSASSISTRTRTRTARSSRKPRLVVATRPVYRTSTFRTSYGRPPSSTRSIIDPTAPQVQYIRSPLISTPLSARSNTSRFEDLYASPLTPLPDPWHVLSGSLSPIAGDRRPLAGRHRSTRRNWSKLFTKRSFKRSRVKTKATLAAVFGFTLLLTLGIYLTLAATGIGSGLMFHILFIIFLLGLTTVFCHSLLMMCLLILGPTKPNRGNMPRGEWTITQAESQPVDELLPEKPIPIVMAIDEEAETGLTGELAEKPTVRPPPPVYGIWRGSSRLNPNLVHWQKLPPSPLTPTYDEAMRDAQRAVGYRPPSYISEGVVVPMAAMAESGEIRCSLINSVHPLERERLVGLIGQAR